MSDNQLVLALRITADMADGQRAVEQFGASLTAAGDKAQAAFSSANQTASQQAEELRTVTAVSREHQAAVAGQSAAADRSGAAAQAAAGNWQALLSALARVTAATDRLAQAQERASQSTQQSRKQISDEGQELSDLLGRIDPVIRKLAELEKLEARLRSARASGQLDDAGFESFSAKLKAQRDALGESANAMRHAGISAGQYQAAMRQLPMQITDITTSLASGMPIWMVAIQQGGQIRDSFGGIGNAGRAMLSAINPVTLALGAVAAAVVATGVAYYQAASEATAYSEALIMTGNVAGTTASAMGDMAARIDKVSGTQHQAAAALAEIARAGKFTEQQLEQIGTTAVLMENTVGQAISATVEDFRTLAENPAKGIAALNDKYHFLTAAVYEQIAALQAEGRETEALQLAIDTLTGAQNQRMAKVVESQDAIARGWSKIKEAMADAWDGWTSIFRQDALAELERDLAALEKRRDTSKYYGKSRSLNEGIEELKAKIAAKKAEHEQAKAAGEQQRANDAAIAAAVKINALEKSLLDKAARRTAEIKEYRAQLDALKAANPNDERLAPERVSQNIAAINAKYEDKKPTPRPDSTPAPAPSEKAYANLNRQITERIALLNAANAAEQKLTETQRFSEKVLASLKDGTHQFTEAQKAAVRAQLDTLAAAEQASQARADSEALQGVQQSLLSSQGQHAEAAAIQLEAQYGDLLRRLEARADTSGADMVRRLINVETAKARMAEVQADIDRILAQRAQGEASIQAQIQTGLMTETEGRKQIIALHQQTADELESVLPKLREIAEITKDPKVVELIEKLAGKVRETKEAASELEKAIRAGFEGGVSNAIQGLVKGTMSLEDAALSFAQTMGDAMLRFAANEMASEAFAGMKSMFDGITGGAEVAKGAMESVKTTKIATDGAMLASSEATMAAQTTTSTVAAAETTAAWTPASIVASIGSWGAAAAIGLTAVIAALAFKAFADGGQVRGPGTTTSDSIPALLSDQEFVTRAAVVNQPGALGFLTDFNRRGMVALDDWSGAVRHATGGLAGVPAPSMPSPLLQSAEMPKPGAGSETTLKNNIDLHVYDDPQRIADQAFKTRQGRDAFFMMLGRDPGKVRSILKI